MGVSIIGDRKRACFYDDTNMVAFGPVFHGEDEAEEFLEWVNKSPIKYDERTLRDIHAEWKMTEYANSSE